MKILLLGGTGAMGTPLSHILDDAGHDVYVTSRSSHKSEGNLFYLKGNAKDYNFLESCLKSKFDAIVDFMAYSTNEFQTCVNLLLRSTLQYVFISSARVFAESNTPLKEDSPRLLDVLHDDKYLSTDEYALAKARQEDILKASEYTNWTIVRPSITYNDFRLQLGAFEKENWLYRALQGRSIVFSHDMEDKLTAMTYGTDVSEAISALIGTKKSIGQTYNIATNQSYTWQEVLDIYLDTLKEVTGKRPTVKMSRETTKLKDKWAYYQIVYARRLSRSFDNKKIRTIYTKQFTSPRNGLSASLKVFLKNPCWSNINWRYEAWNDIVADERTPLSEIPGYSNKVMYLCYRNHMDFFYNVVHHGWRIVKRVIKCVVSIGKSCLFGK